MLAGFSPDVLSLHKAFDIFVDELGDRRSGHVTARCHGCGKPIVATTAGGIPEVVVDGETGFLVPPRDHQAMADALVKLLKDDELRKTDGRRRPVRARSKFSADRMVQETLRVYQRVAMHRIRGDDA